MIDDTQMSKSKQGSDRYPGQQHLPQTTPTEHTLMNVSEREKERMGNKKEKVQTQVTALDKSILKSSFFYLAFLPLILKKIVSCCITVHINVFCVVTGGHGRAQ